MAGLNQSAMLMFDKEDDKINDICLLVDDRKFWCSKQHLSLHSNYFYAMFNKNFTEGNAEEIFLNDPENSNVFHLFLIIIHGYRPFEEFDDATITSAMALSNLWFAKLPSQVCMEFLLKSERSQYHQKCALAEKNALEEYKKQIDKVLKQSSIAEQLNQSSILKFDVEDEKINDVCLVVKDRKFWVSKHNLSLHSERFSSIFNGGSPEATIKEITLNDPVKSKDFHLFLLIINGLRPFDEFNDKTITRVMALSNKWTAKMPYQVCMEHLMKSERSTTYEKYHWALIHKLRDYEHKLDEVIDKDPELRLERARRPGDTSYQYERSDEWRSVKYHRERRAAQRRIAAGKLKIHGLPAHRAPLVQPDGQKGHFLRSRRGAQKNSQQGAEAAQPRSSNANGDAQQGGAAIPRGNSGSGAQRAGGRGEDAQPQIPFLQGRTEAQRRIYRQFERFYFPGPEDADN